MEIPRLNFCFLFKKKNLVLFYRKSKEINHIGESSLFTQVYMNDVPVDNHSVCINIITRR